MTDNDGIVFFFLGPRKPVEVVNATEKQVITRGYKRGSLRPILMGFYSSVRMIGFLMPDRRRRRRRQMRQKICCNSELWVCEKPAQGRMMRDGESDWSFFFYLFKRPTEQLTDSFTLRKKKEN